MATVLNIVSFCATLTVAVMMLYLLQNYTIGRIPALSRLLIFQRIYFKDIVFIAIALFLILRYTEIYLPY